MLALGLMLNAVGCGDSDELSGSSTAPAPLTSADVMKTGSYSVGVTTMTFVDSSRPTMANGSYPGAPDRTLVTEIWYPTATNAAPDQIETRDAPLARNGRPYPLVIYSHGFISNRLAGAYLAQHMASHGYVVAAPDYPLTHGGSPGGASFFDVANQPGDISFIIDRLLALHADAGSAFAGGIDAQRIGLTGLSLGGMTTYLATFDAPLRDRRVRAAAPQAGPGCSFAEKFYATAQVPLMIVHGDIDAVVAYQQNSVFAFGEARRPKYLVTIRGGSHTGFVDDGGLFENLNNPDDIGCQALRGGGGGGADPEETFIEMLGGAEAGIITGDCPAGCAGPRHGPRSIRPSRQRQLTILSVFPFFDAYLRGDARALDFIQHTFAAENTDADLQAQP